jgi:hypothetical protein
MVVTASNPAVAPGTVAAWRAGAISRETLLEALKCGDVLPDGRSVSDEKKLLHRAGAVAVG